jgi:hypothetical protein
MESFRSDVEEEYIRYHKKNGPIHDLHQGWGLLYEEFDELWLEIKKKPRKRSVDDLKRELVQISTLAEMIYEDVVRRGL